MNSKPPGPQASKPSGHLIAFEGLDQSGKQTQSERLLAQFRAAGYATEFLTFPEYTTAIGEEIGRALKGERDYQPDTLQLLYIANRFEFRPRITEWLAAGTMVVCDRYLASSIAYGDAQGLDAEWLTAIQRHLAQPSLTLFMDMPPETSLMRRLAAPRQVRARHAAAWPRPGELRSAIAGAGLGPRRRGGRQGFRVSRRDQRRSLTTRAAVRPENKPTE